MDAALRAALRGNEDGFRVLYRVLHPGLLRYLRVLVGDGADDVASEAWLQVTRDLRSFRGDFDGFRGWVTTIARHRAMDHLRRMRRRPEDMSIDHLVDVAAGEAAEDTEGAALDGLATYAAVALIARLPPDQAEAVMLRVVMGLDAKAAGQVLGKRAGAVRTAAYRGLRKLAKMLENSDGPVTDLSGSRPRDPASAPSRIEGVTRTRAPSLKDMR